MILITNMRTSHLSWFFFTLSVAAFLSITTVFVSGQCQSDQQELLLGFKTSLNSSSSMKLVKWNESTDCCSWDGITCDASGRIIELDLNDRSISGAIDDSNSLFHLQHLQQLNLAHNELTSKFPSGFENLTNLRYLNLSCAGFVGRIPVGISRLTELTTLDLSTSWDVEVSPKLEMPDITMFVQNLTKLKHLYLDGVNISANGNEWSRTLPSLLPNLQVLSMIDCFLSGPIHPSLAKLKSLSVIRLNNNNFSALFPEDILQTPKLQTLDLSSNQFLQGSFQKFPQNASLQSLVVSGTNFGGQLPESIDNLGELTRIELANCKFNGSIPEALEKLTRLTYLDFFNNSFSGPVPSFTSLRNLTVLNLGANQLNGSIHSTNWSSLLNLKSLHLEQNSLSGNVPPTLFQSRSLKEIDLSQNQFTGGFREVKGNCSSLLESINLSHNRLQGPFPMFIFEIQSLVILSFSWNKFSGLMLLSAFQKLKNLWFLDLSYNNLSIDTSYTKPLLSPLPPNISRLELASCNLTKFPDFLKNLSSLSHLDLSNNRIHGEIPSWIWEQSLVYLNLSLNFLVELETPLNITAFFIVVDVHGNQLQGQIPKFPLSAGYLDYSNNNFTSILPPEIGDFLQFASLFSLSGNRFYGSIPESICNSSLLQVLDLSNNSLSGPIPQCLIQMSASLGVLNLKRNNLGGEIPDAFPSNCSILTLDLNRNQLGGKVPKSLANCRMLEVLDFGNNRIDDTFPCHLKSTSRLRLLGLRSNKFKGDVNCRGNDISWPMLQIIDLAFNSFSGKPPQGMLMTWNAMKTDKYGPYAEHLEFDLQRFSEFLPFQYSTTVIFKGLQLELVKILTIFTYIDFSSNKFEGHIPEAIGHFKALYLLNLSSNTLTGTVPLFLGTLSKLESLDLSRNHLTGQIPLQLADLNFLSFLNLSNNKLTGKIPSGTQLQSFSEASFDNNAGLCGLPLVEQCETPPATKHGPSNSGSGNHVDWNLISVEIGFVFGLGVAILPLMFWKRWRVWYYKRTDRVLYKFFPKLDRRNRYRMTIARRPQGRRQ